MKTILMEENFCANSHFSLAKFYCRISVNGTVYVIVNKEGKDLFQCSIEAEKAGRTKAIEPGEPADMIDERYLSLYRQMGRDKFIEILKNNNINSPREMENIYNQIKNK